MPAEVLANGETNLSDKNQFMQTCLVHADILKVCDWFISGESEAQHHTHFSTCYISLWCFFFCFFSISVLQFTLITLHSKRAACLKQIC